MSWPNHSVIQYLDDVARPSALWAGGSVAALTAAEGWALIEMIALISLKHEKAPATVSLKEQATQGRQRLLDLAALDVDAYKEVLRVRTSDAYYRATEVPLEVLFWAKQGLMATYHPMLISHLATEPDRITARALFEAVRISALSLISANLSFLDETSRVSVFAALRDWHESIPE